MYARNPTFPSPAKTYLASLSTCRQIRTEGLLRFCSLHTFEFRYAAQIESFSAAVGVAAWSVVKSVRLVVQAITIQRGVEVVQAAFDECLVSFPTLENAWVQVQNLIGVILADVI